MGYIRWTVFISIPSSIPTPNGLLGNELNAETAILPDRFDKPYLFKNRIYSMIGITAFGLLALSLPVFASTDTPASSSPLGWIGALLTLLIWYVCASRRKKEIGGWLLYYYIFSYM